MTGPGTPTVADLLLARAGDEHAGLRFEDETWSWAEYVRTCFAYGSALGGLLRAGAPPHVGVLADNVPALAFLLGGAALSGNVVVGLNPTRRGAALARDVRTADCQVVLAEGKHLAALEGLDVPVLDLDSPEWTDRLRDVREPAAPTTPPRLDDLLMLIFTSGTGGSPKAVRCTHSKIAFPGTMLADRFRLSTSDTVYVAMPMFHSNAVMAGWAVGLAAGATIALRRRFSASGFLPDVRKFGATYSNYVGTPLSYVLAQPRKPDDADNPLRIVYGNEGNAADLAEFGERFGTAVVDAFGSTEGGIGFSRTPDTPPGALGKPPEDVRILHPETGMPCPPVEFAEDGSPRGTAEAVGEMVNVAGPGAFAGYYNDPDADAERMRDGRYHTGDLAYADKDGYFYFAGRLGDWLRVGGENLGTAPIERVLLRHPGIAEATVYGIQDRVGDQIMAAVVPEPDATLTSDGLAEFLATQPDLGPKQWPRFVRIASELPRTATYKILKRTLAAEGTNCQDPVLTLT